MASSDRELTHIPVLENRVQCYSGVFEDSQLDSSQIDVLASGACVPSRSVTAQIGQESHDFNSQTSSNPDSALQSLFTGALAVSVSQENATIVPVRHDHGHDTARQVSATDRDSDTSIAFDSAEWQEEFELERKRIRDLLKRSSEKPEAEENAELKRQDLLWRDYQLSGGTVSRENFLRFPGCGIRRVCNYPEASASDANAE
ncbi:hypothetical protein CPB85DRAFT_494477 [Mucidula mucida]|nr:hypothetical protein CPB85DRAFT_494477 [Mucidula mucida]